MILLGPGNSGKSTLMRQLLLLHGQGFSKELRDIAKEQTTLRMLRLLQSILLLIQKKHVEIFDQFDAIKDLILQANDASILSIHQPQVLDLWKTEALQQLLPELHIDLEDNHE